MSSKESKKNVERQFSKWTEDDVTGFETIANNIFQPIYRWLIVDIEAALNRSIGGLRVLDIGGGPGNMAVEFLKAGAEKVIEVDLSPIMLERAETRVKEQLPELFDKFSARLGDAAQLPVSSKTIDLVFSRGSVQFWPDLAGAFDEIKRVLTDGGAAYIGGGYGIRMPIEAKEEIVKRKAAHDAELGITQIPRMNRAEMEKLARERGGKAEMLGEAPGFWLFWRL